MVLRLPNPKRNKGAGVIPVALCLTYGGQVIVSLVTQDFVVKELVLKANRASSNLVGVEFFDKFYFFALIIGQITKM